MSEIKRMRNILMLITSVRVKIQQFFLIVVSFQAASASCCLLLSNQFFVLVYLFTCLLVSRTQPDSAHMQTSAQLNLRYI